MTQQIILVVFYQPHLPYDELFITIVQSWKEIQIRRALFLFPHFSVPPSNVVRSARIAKKDHNTASRRNK